MRKNIFYNPVLLLKLFASVMYITMGLIILAVPSLTGKLGLTLTYALSILLIVYGIVRLIRVVTELRENTGDKIQ